MIDMLTTESTTVFNHTVHVQADLKDMAEEGDYQNYNKITHSA